MKRLKSFIRILVTSAGIIFIFAVLGLIGSTTSTASGINGSSTSNSAILEYENAELSKVSDMYGNFMTEFYPLITGEKVDFNNLPTDSLKKYLNKVTELFPDVSPIKTDDSLVVSSSFGWRTSPTSGKRQFHTGVDINLPMHTKIYSTMSGTVVKIEYTTKATYGLGYGNYIVIRNNLGFETLYAHLSSIYVKKDEVVTKGQLVANLGRTGNATGPCLHYEITQSDELKDPLTELFINHNDNLMAKK